jgi:hypothetical protein
LQIVTLYAAATSRANGQRVMATMPDGSHVVYVGNLGHNRRFAP